MSSLIEKAKQFADKRHGDQRRPDRAGTPHAMHRKEVAALIRKSGGTEAEIAAGYLHDTREDAGVTDAEIILEFGAEVADIVDGLTDHVEIENLPIFARKKLQALRVRGKSASVKRCKMAGGISNILSVRKDPPLAWSAQDCLDYIDGCRMVADECAGVSTYLDRVFDAAYPHARKVYAPAGLTVLDSGTPVGLHLKDSGTPVGLQIKSE